MPEEKDNFYSIEDVLKELKLNEEDLKRMVSEGELQAFRKPDDQMQFKKEDIDNIRRGKITEPTVILPPDELLKSEEGVGKDETFIEEDTSSITEELPFGDTDITIPTLEEEKISLEGEETGTVTTPLKDTEGTFIEETIPESEATVAEEFSETVAERPHVLKPPPRPSGIVKRRPSYIAPAEMMPAVKPRVHPVFIIMLVFAFLLLMFIGSFLGDIVRISTGKTNYPVGITREFGKLVVDIFGLKDETGAQNIDLMKYQP